MPPNARRKDTSGYARQARDSRRFSLRLVQVHSLIRHRQGSSNLVAAHEQILGSQTPKAFANGHDQNFQFPE